MPSTNDPSSSPTNSLHGLVATECAPAVVPPSTVDTGGQAVSSNVVTSDVPSASSTAGKSPAAPPSAAAVAPGTDKGVLQSDDNARNAPIGPGIESPMTIKTDPDSGAACPPAGRRREEEKWKKYVPLLAKLGIVVLFHAYLVAGIVLTWNKAPDFCHDVKLLAVLTGVAYFFLLWYAAAALFDRFIMAGDVGRNILDSISSAKHKRHWLRPCLWFSVWFFLLLSLVYDSMNDSHRLISLGGIVVIIFFGFLCSKYPSKVNWYQVMWGLLLQFILGLGVLRWSHGRNILECLAQKVKHFLDYTNRGSFFVFGHLSSGWNLTEALGELATVTFPRDPNLYDANTTGTADIKSLFPVFAFQALPVIFFFSFFVNILYFYGIMQWLVMMVGKFLQLTTGTTVCESMTAAANIFLGMSEAPLIIRPFLSKMTMSELHTVMTSGFSTIAGSVMAAYISFGVSPGHLITASIMSAPAALACSKLLYPETEESKTQLDNIVMPKCEERNVLEAASNGCSVGLIIVGNIVANLVAFLAFIAFLNSLLLWIGSIITLDFLTFEWVLAKLFTPLAFVMGIPWKDCSTVGELIGIKTFANEFIAYSRLALILEDLDTRSVVIATYALCGFSNFGSVGICLGALGAMAPERKGDFASVSLRALVAGSSACFLTACVAGSLIL